MILGPNGEEWGISSLDREDEAIEGAAATEFTVEANEHPERYNYLAGHVARLAQALGKPYPTIFDLGCGPAILTGFIADQIPKARVTGIDLSGTMVALAQKQVQPDVRIVHADVRATVGQTEQLADIIVSRSMLHRLEVLEEGLMTMARLIGPGGVLFNTSFRNPTDLPPAEQAAWHQNVLARNPYPALQKAYVLAFLNAPKLSDYRVAARKVAHRVDAKQLFVWPGRDGQVHIQLHR